MATLTMSNFIPQISGEGLMTWTLIILFTILVLGAIGIYFWKRYQNKKYSEYKVVIWSKDSVGRIHEKYDRGGVFINKKTGLRLLRLQKVKKAMNPNHIPYVTGQDSKNRIIKTIYLRQVGVSNYVFCHMKLDDNGVLFKVGEEDVNWAAEDMIVLRNTFNKESWLSKIAPYAMFIISMILIMIVVISGMNKFDSLGKSMTTITENQNKITTSQERISDLLYNVTQTPAMNANTPIIIGAGGKK